MPLIKKKGCRVWYYRCKVNGKAWERSTGQTDKRKAEREVPNLEALAELHRKQPSDCLKLKKAIVREVERVELELGERRASRVGCSLENFFKYAGSDMPLERIGKKMLRDFQLKRNQDVAKDTVDRELCDVCRMLRENGFMIEKPKPLAGKVNEVREFTRDELKAFFEHCPDEFFTLFMFMLSTGARPSDIVYSPRSNHVPLLKSEVDLSAKVVTIRQSKGLPGRKKPQPIVRTLPDDLIKPLKQHIKQTRGQYVFPEIKNLARVFNDILSEAKIEKRDALNRKLVAHSFRHTYGTIASESLGGNQFALKAILGHSQISTTARYVHMKPTPVVIPISDLIGGGVEKVGGKDPENNEKDLHENAV